jgi:hypothetical protein
MPDSYTGTKTILERAISGLYNGKKDNTLE